MIPSSLLHYRILQPLGSGGMGDVYLAEDTKLGRRVALKVLPHGHAVDPERQQRFEREARAIAALNHPNIVTIHAVERADEITFLTMELVEGKTLAEVIPKGGLPLDRILKIAIPLASAVTAAHERGITHRDLKPANVMIGQDGRVKVLDFGLAKLEEADGIGFAKVFPRAQLRELPSSHEIYRSYFKIDLPVLWSRTDRWPWVSRHGMYGVFEDGKMLALVDLSAVMCMWKTDPARIITERKRLGANILVYAMTRTADLDVKP